MPESLPMPSPVEQPHVTLPGGVSMPQFGLGLWRTPADDAASVVRTALEAGYRAVDGAAIYGNERGLGEALASGVVPRDDVFVTTKLWNDRQGYDATLGAFDSSLKRLGIDTLDLYLIHWPAPERGLYVESWKAMARLKAEGRVRAIGVSNFNLDHLERIVGETGETPAVNQIELHPDFQQRALREAHERLGVLTESWSPLGQGQLLDHPVLVRIGEKHGKTAAQAVIRWHLDSGLIVIPKSVTPSRIVENIAVFDFALDAEDMAAIAALDDPGARIGPDPATADF